MTRQELERISFKHAMRNYDEVKSSKRCACYFCLQRFDSSKANYYITERDGIKTALCPFCSVDSVIGDASGYDIDGDIITELNLWGFGIKVFD